MQPVLVVLCVAWFSLGVASAQTVTLHFQERPPYSSSVDNGNVVGLVASPAERALRAASVPFVWAKTPGQRQLALIQSGKGLHCGVGWFHSTDRAAQGRFSQPLYQDQPFCALARTQSPVGDEVPAARLIDNTRLRLLVKEGYSYGPQLDAWIRDAQRKPESTSADPLQMSRMVLADRADWMIVAPEEATTLNAVGLRLIKFTDVANGPTRHLYCSHDVPEPWMARINQALAAQGR